MGYKSNASDNEDASTRVSSKSQAARNQYYHNKNINLDYLNNAVHDMQTPKYVKNLEHVNRRPEQYNYDNVNVNAGLAQLPQIKPNARMNSVDIDRMEREQRLNCYIMPQ